MQFILPFSLTLCLLAVSACSSTQTDTETGHQAAKGETDNPAGSSDGEPSLEDDKPVPVRLTELKVEKVARLLELSGTIASDRDISVISETAGRVVIDSLALGKRVKKGAVLLAVDSEPFRTQLERSEAELECAEVAEEQARVELERAKSLREGGDLSEALFDQARFAHRRAKAAGRAATAGVTAAGRALRLSSIRAPFEGVIANQFVRLGDTIGTGTPIARLVDDRHLKVKIGVGEDDIGSVWKGLPGLIRIPTLNAQPYKVTVSAVGIKALEPTMTYPVELSFETRPEKGLKVGMIAHVELRVGEPVEALLLPLEVLVERFDRHYVFVSPADGGKVEERRVETGRKFGRRVILTDGVRPGERVVTTGQAKLQDGSKVKVVE